MISTENDISLPADAHANARAVAAYINGQDGNDRALALESECEYLQRLSDPTTSASLLMIADQLPVLLAIFHRLSVDAVNCRTPAAKAQLTKAALHAQNSYTRTVALLADLHLQQRDRARLTVDSEPWE
jgi:hypothetical protein